MQTFIIMRRTFAENTSAQRKNGSLVVGVSDTGLMNSEPISLRVTKSKAAQTSRVPLQ